MKRREQKERENIISTAVMSYVKMRGDPTYINYNIIMSSNLCRTTGLQPQNSRRICRHMKVKEKPQHKYGFIKTYKLLYKFLKRNVMFIAK
jgi:hypothetical protein